MSRLRVEEVILVEGKYDAVKLADLVDGLILTTDGFSIFHNKAARQLILELGKKRGILVLTDSDAAGFRIRNYINQFARGVVVKNAYIPAIAGKERRKAAPSREGLLGVDLPDDKLQPLVAGIKAKLAAADIGGKLEGLKKLF